MALVILTALVITLPPLALALVVLLTSWGRPTWRLHSSSVLVGAIVAVFGLQVAARVEGIHTVVAIGLSLLLGGSSTYLYRRTQAASMYLSFLGLAPLLVSGLFLLTPPISVLTFPWTVDSHGVELSSSASVVFLIFDELPQVSLLNAQQEIDSLRFPNLARLAEDATWFRNAAPAHPYTTRSIPSLLSGELPDPSRLATATDFPNSIFTLFGQTHGLHVVEPLTDLCPDSLCSSAPTPVWGEVQELTRITSQLYLRIVAPDLFDENILVLDDPFERGERITNAMRANRPAEFREFVERIDGQERQFYFGHFLLPHGPQHYLPSGVSYNRLSQSDPGLNKDGVWTGDPWHTLDNHQRHLLQVVALDGLVGDMIDHLERIGAYDETMIVITSDHGVAHLPGGPRRDVSAENLFDIGLVPLIVKEPHQVEGVVDDRLIHAIDVVPTLADLLEADRPWPGDGLSIVGGNGRDQLLMRNQDNEDVEIDVTGPGRKDAVQRVISRFGESGTSNDLYAFGPFGNLVGSNVASLSSGEPTIHATIDEPLLYSFVEINSGFVPAYISGEVENLGRLPGEPYVGLVVGGVVGAVVPLYDVEVDVAKFGGVVSDSLFRDGSNSISLLLLYLAEDGEMVVDDVSSNIAPTFALSGTAPEELESSIGGRFRIDPDAVVGFVDSAILGDGHRTLTGWAIDSQSLNPVEAVVFFVGERFVVSVVPNAERRGLADQFGTESVLMSGFAVPIPEATLGDDMSRVRVYGVSAAGATELVIVEPVRTQLGMTG